MITDRDLLLLYAEGQKLARELGEDAAMAHLMGLEVVWDAARRVEHVEEDRKERVTIAVPNRRKRATFLVTCPRLKP